jgi:hypothetical protein
MPLKSPSPAPQIGQLLRRRISLSSEISADTFQGWKLPEPVKTDEALGDHPRGRIEEENRSLLKQTHRRDGTADTIVVTAP